MDFGDILDDWEKRSAKPGGLDAASKAEERLKDGEEARRAEADEERRRRETAARKSLAHWLDEYGVHDKDRDCGPQCGAATPADDRAARESEARRLKAKKADDVLDLHGMTQAQAEAALEAFLRAASQRGLEKVLVITGKGIHSQGEPILGRAARRVIEASPYAGRFGAADAQEGGSGALYVIVRHQEPGGKKPISRGK